MCAVDDRASGTAGSDAIIVAVIFALLLSLFLLLRHKAVVVCATDEASGTKGNDAIDSHYFCCYFWFTHNVSFFLATTL